MAYGTHAEGYDGKPWTPREKSTRARHPANDPDPIRAVIGRARSAPRPPLHMRIEEDMGQQFGAKRGQEGVNNFFGTPGRPSSTSSDKTDAPHGNFRLKDGSYLGENWEGEIPVFSRETGLPDGWVSQMTRRVMKIAKNSADQHRLLDQVYAMAGRRVEEGRKQPDLAKGLEVHRNLASIANNELPERVDLPSLQQLVDVARKAGLTPEQTRAMVGIHVMEQRNDHGFNITEVDRNDRNRIAAMQQAGVKLNFEDRQWGEIDPRGDPTLVQTQAAVGTFLEALRRHNGDIRGAVRRYNGAGPSADQYLSKFDKLQTALSHPANRYFNQWLDRAVPVRGQR